jgi:hypothetical protein
MKLNDVAVTPHMSLPPKGNPQLADGLFGCLIMLKSNMAGANQRHGSGAVKATSCPNRAKSVRFAHLAHHP